MTTHMLGNFLIAILQSITQQITNQKNKQYMFSNAYQNGPHLQVFDSKVSSDKNQFYKQLYKITPNTNKKYFDKEVKSYLYDFQGLNARISFPADDHKQLSLHQRYLVLQVYVSIGSSWSMEIGMTDISKTKRRINITTTHGKEQSKYFFFKYPLNNLQRGVWLFLGIDVLSFMEVFKGQVFRSLDTIVIGSNCRLRRVFTLKQWNQWDIPKSYWLPGQIQQSMQLIEYCSQKKTQPSLVLSQPVHELSRIRDSSKIEQKPGSKVVSNRSPLQSNSKKEEIFKKPLQQNQKVDKLSVRGNLTKNMASSQIVGKGNSKARVNTMLDNSEIKGDLKKSIDKERSFSKSKAPAIQKSFKEDQALMVPAQQSDIPYADSLESRQAKISRQQEIQQDKWSDDERPKYPTKNPFSEHLNNMSEGFPTTTITKQNNETLVLQKKEKQVQLIYDQMVGCYYHPQTNTYYQIEP